MTKARMGVTLVVIALIIGCAQAVSTRAITGTASKTLSTATDVEAVTRTIQRLTEAIDNRDIDSIKSLYGTTVIWYRRNRPSLAPHSWVVGRYEEFFEEYRSDIDVQILDVIVRQDVATVYTMRSGVVRGSDSGAVVRDVHDMVVYTLMTDEYSDGWRILVRLGTGLEEGGV